MASPVQPGGPSGTQSIERVFDLLRRIASAGDEGVRLSQLVASTELKQPTVSRLVQALVGEGLVEQDARTKAFHLGVEAFLLGALASSRFGAHKQALDSLSRLATVTEDSAFFSVPRGSLSVCLHREEGAFPIRTQALNAGDRYPLGVGAGSLALLAAMPDDAIDEAIDANFPALSGRYPAFNRALIWRLVGETRERGYAVNEGLVVAGSWGVGVVVRGPDDDAPVGALSIAAIESRLGPTRQQEIAKLLQEEAHRVQEKLRRFHDQGSSRRRQRVTEAAKPKAVGDSGRRSRLPR